MKVIQCILPDAKPGRTAEIGGKEYVFTNNSKGDLVCEVGEPEHVKRFLGIPEGYRQYGAKKEPKGSGKKEAPSEPTETVAHRGVAHYSFEEMPELPPVEELSKLSDEELERLAQARYGIDLDRRENEASIVAEILRLEAGITEVAEPKSSSAEEAAPTKTKKKSTSRKKTTRSKRR